MSPNIYRYSFSKKVLFRDVEESLFLAAMAAESLYGRSRIRMDLSFSLDKEKRICVIDAGNEIGRSVGRIFTEFITREFGEEAFQVERLNALNDPVSSLKAVSNSCQRET